VHRRKNEIEVLHSPEPSRLAHVDIPIESAKNLKQSGMPISSS
jgi:hypothetical protein